MRFRAAQVATSAVVKLGYVGKQVSTVGVRVRVLRWDQGRSRAPRPRSFVCDSLPLRWTACAGASTRVGCQGRDGGGAARQQPHDGLHLASCPAHHVGTHNARSHLPSRAQEAGGAVTRHRSSRLALPSRAAGHSAEARADFFTSACVPLATRVQDIGIGEQRSGTDGLAVHFQKRRGDGGRGWYPDLHVQGCRPGREYARVCVQGATRPCVCVCARARARMSKHC